MPRPTCCRVSAAPRSWPTPPAPCRWWWAMPGSWSAVARSPRPSGASSSGASRRPGPTSRRPRGSLPTPGSSTAPRRPWWRRSGSARRGSSARWRPSRSASPSCRASAVAGLEDLLASRAAFGMRLGLERMRALLTELGEPQRAFRALHVVGTNGKTSTTLFSAAILQAHGLMAGAYISPHVHGFRERVQAGGAPLEEAVLTAAVERVEAAAAVVEATSDEPLTQFEVLTAAAFTALQAADVDVVAVEAGLGGRYDATNVLAAPVVALTNVGLDHVEQLGGTRAAIAAEKLAVLAPGAALVAGSVDAEIEPVIRHLAAAAGSVTLLPPGADVPDAPPLAAPGRYQRENLALALTACERLLGDAFDRPRALAAAARVVVPGRLQQIGTEPLVLVDGAHNPHGAA